MFKKLILAAAVAFLGTTAFAQVNLQTFYDFGSDRQHVTTTLELFKGDAWGNTFAFIDYDYNAKNSEGKVVSPSGTYMEIARCLNFWQDSKLGAFSLQVEYNGGAYIGYGISSAFLCGVDYFVHSKDFSKRLNLKVLGKAIMGQNGENKLPLQLTAVWGLDNIFGVKGLNFSGFADFWGEKHSVITGEVLGVPTWEDRSFVFISEPQLWYNVGQFFGCENLNIGGELELSYDFGTGAGFFARPCAGFKWVF